MGNDISKYEELRHRVREYHCCIMRRYAERSHNDDFVGRIYQSFLDPYDKLFAPELAEPYDYSKIYAKNHEDIQ